MISTVEFNWDPDADQELCTSTDCGIPQKESSSLVDHHWANPSESMESTGTSSNDKVQSDVEALDTLSPENEAIGNTTTSGIIAPAPSDGESAPRRSSPLCRRPERYEYGHLGQATLKEG